MANPKITRPMDHMDLLTMAEEIILRYAPMVARTNFMNQLDAQRCPRCGFVFEQLMKSDFCNDCTVALREENKIVTV